MDAFRIDYGQYGYDGELKTLLTSGEGFKTICSIEYINDIIETDIEASKGFWNRKYNNFPMKPLGRKSPNEKYKEFQAL